jgi:hypothetical protein
MNEYEVENKRDIQDALYLLFSRTDIKSPASEI